MKHWYKIPIIFAAGFLAVYVLAALSIEVILYANKERFEKESARIMGVESVHVGRMLNFPLVSIDLQNTVVSNGFGDTAGAKLIRIRYNLLNALFKSLPAALTYVRVDNLRVDAGFSNLFSIISNYSGTVSNSSGTNDFLKDIQASVYFKDVQIHVDFGGGVSGLLNDKQTLLSIKDGKADMQSYFYLEAVPLNGKKFIHSQMEVRMNWNIPEKTGTGHIVISNITAAGIPVFSNEKVDLVFSNRIYVNSRLTNLFQDEGGKYRFSVHKDFTIAYNKYNEKEWIDYLLTPGKYQIDLSGIAGPSYEVRTLIKKQNGEGESIQAVVTGTNDHIHFQGGYQTVKFGTLSADLNFSSASFLPNGTLTMRAFPFLDGGLKAGGDLQIYSSGNKTTLNGKNVFINGGPIGTANTTIQIETNGVFFSSSAGKNNAIVNGFIKKDSYEINVTGTDIPGTAVVSNIVVDLFGIGKTRVWLGMHLYSDKKGDPVIQANLTGYMIGKNDTKEKWMTSRVEFSDMNLRFPDLNFESLKMKFNLNFHFTATNRIWTYIDVNGGLLMNHLASLPVKGRIDVNGDTTNTHALFSIDKKLTTDITGDASSMVIKIKTDAYDLSKIGIPGSLDFNFETMVRNNLIENILIDSTYAVNNRSAQLYFKAVRNKDVLNILQMMLDNRDDKLFGNGKLWQKGDRLLGQVDFIRGGGLIFSSSFEDINASIDIRNLYFKKFFNDNTDVFFSTSLTLFGPLLFPDFTGSVRILNGINSEEFVLNIPYLSRVGSDWKIKNLYFKNPDNGLNLDADASLESSGLSLSASGNFLLFSSLIGKYKFNYYSTTNQNSLSYQLADLAYTGKKLQDMNGGFISETNRITFFKKGNYGFSGYINKANNNQDWVLDFTGSELNGNFTGDIKGEKLDGELKLNIPLNLFAFTNVFTELKGNSSLDLKMSGSTNNPVFDGSLRLYQVRLETLLSGNRVRDLNMNIPVSKNKILFNNVSIPNSGGEFFVNGFVDVNDWRSPNFNIKIEAPEKKKAVLNLKLNSDNLKIKGDIPIKKLSLTGSLQNIQISGDISAENASIQMPLSGMVGNSDNSGGNILDNIVWNLPVTIGNNVNFANEVIDVFLKRNDQINILGSTKNGSFSIKGKVGVDRGSLTYLGRDFLVTEGSAFFNGVPGDLIPYVNVQSQYRYKDESKENVDVYLTFEGKVSKIMLKDFYSIPSRNRGELNAQLGLKTEIVTDTNARFGSLSQSLVLSGVNMAENMVVINPITLDIKRRLGLDLFTVRTGFLENLARNSMNGQTNVNLIDMFEGTSLSAGKYILPSLLVQYDMMMARNPTNQFDLVPLHSFGMEFDFKNVDFGWKLQQFADTGKGIQFEQQFKINVNNRF